VVVENAEKVATEVEQIVAANEEQVANVNEVQDMVEDRDSL